MWKKEEEQGPTVDSPSRVASPRPTTQASGRATIGPSISIRGDVTGSEDLLIQGKIDGSVMLNDHSVGVGSEGRVTADIVGRLITIEGYVEGDLTAQEQIVLRGSAQVKGDIKAPRVVLEDGATFRGLVDMGSAAKSEDRSKSRSASGTESASSSGSGSGNVATDDSKAKPTSQSKGATGASGSASASGSSSGSSTSSGSSGKSKETSRSADRTNA